MSATVAREHGTAFACLGGRTAVMAGGPHAERLLGVTRSRLHRWHRALTRFEAYSELSLLNAAPVSRVPVSELMLRFADAAVEAARQTGGLVDPTLVGEIEAAGYAEDWSGESLELGTSLALAPPRAPARPDPRARWSRVTVDGDARTVNRPVGIRLDSGGVAKGLFADMAGEALAVTRSYAVDCCGDLRLGGTDGYERSVEVADPFGRGEPLHEFHLSEGGVATSGIGRRSWAGPDGTPAHHLIDPSTGRPAWTGVVQATAIAPTATEAEYRAKAALLSGPASALEWLGRGGVIVFDDGSHEVIEP
jgi:thiamine biosynthesis lipoprotein